MTNENISEVECNYWRYRTANCFEEGIPANVLANVVEDVGGISAQEALSEGMEALSLQTMIFRLLPPLEYGCKR